MSAVSARVGAAIRGEFPIFEHKTYLNSCSQGALSHRVRAAYEEYLAGWDENGAEWEFWVERSEAARAGFAELIHGDADEVAVTTSVSQGVNGIVSALPFERGGRNRIVISEYEFPTVGQIAHAQELRGAEVVHVRPDADGSIPAERFAEAIDERTALVCCTTISYRTGHRHDVSAIAEVAHASGALVLADSYQAAGAIEVDVRTLGADFVTGGTVKYLLASAGLGFLWVRREVLAGLTPTQTGWFADEDIFQMDISDYSPHATARRFDAGTPPVPNIYAGVAGLGLVQETGVPAIEAHVSALNTRLIAGLERARRRRRHAGRPGPARASRLRALDRCSGSRRIARRGEHRLLAARHEPPHRGALLQHRRRHRRAPRRAVAPPAAARLTGVAREPGCRPRARSPTATTPTRSATCTCRPATRGRRAMAGGRPDPRRLLALRLGPDADDAAGAGSRRSRDRGLEHRVPARRAGGRRLAGDARGRRRCGRRSRRPRGHRREPRRHGRPLGGRAPRALARRAAPAPRGSTGRRTATAAVAAPSRRQESATSSQEPGPASAAARARRSSAASPTMCRSATRSPHPPRCCRSGCRSCSSTAPATTSCRAGQSRDYAAAARAAGDAVDLIELPEADHFDVIEATDPAWSAVVDWLRDRV